LIIYRKIKENEQEVHQACCLKEQPTRPVRIQMYRVQTVRTGKEGCTFNTVGFVIGFLENLSCSVSPRETIFHGLTFPNPVGACSFSVSL